VRCPHSLLSAVTIAALGCCTCSCPGRPPAPGVPSADASQAAAQPAVAAAADAGSEAPDEAALTEAPPQDAAPGPRTEVGPYEFPFLPGRDVFVVLPRSTAGPQRLLANLHGVCNPPGYACGYWVQASSEQGLLVCPTGNARCGAEAYNAPTWTSTYAKMGEDLEKAIEVVMQRYPDAVTREGAVLTGFSKGAYAAVEIALRNPGRWPYLILNEADVALSDRKLREAGVRAVALLAGERGSQLAGERRTVQALTARGFPARLWVMPRAGHFYSDNIDQLMREALEFVLSH
jgi:predicted esterase